MTEQQIINILYFVFFYIPQSCIFYISLNLMLTPKSKKARIISLTLCPVLNFISFTAMTQAPQVINLILSLSFVLVPALLLFKEPIKHKIMSSVMLMVIYLIFDVIMATLTLDVFGYYPNKLDVLNWDSVYSALTSDFLIMVFIYPICRFWGIKVRKLNESTLTLFFLFPINQILFISACTYGFWKGNNFNIFGNVFVPLAIVFSVFADIAMYLALRENSKINEMNMKMLEMEHALELQYNYYSTITREYEEIRQYRHDINNLVSAVDAMIQNNNYVAEGEKLAESLKERASVMDIPVFCANPIVNTVLWQKKQKAHSLGIGFSVSMELSEDFPIERMDICSLFANLIDNATEEASKHKNAEVSIRASREMGMLFIEVTNPTDYEFSSDTGYIESTKSGRNHGLGIEIVRKITEKYNGNFVIKASDGMAAAKVCLTLNTTA